MQTFYTNCYSKVVIKTLDITLWKSTRTCERETAYDGSLAFCVEPIRLINHGNRNEWPEIWMYEVLLRWMFLVKFSISMPFKETAHVIFTEIGSDLQLLLLDCSWNDRTLCEGKSINNNFISFASVSSTKLKCLLVKLSV